ncbi:response regulator [Haloplanus rallus]|uniref:Response regulator n=1 Tax=Haloplanus rallus TaxID=1816183 RepID=A0A6B9F904_9EURY|nr:response regulator [Haloplanus rallus]QGX96132.1 response regulator [Haloplanus rallus]
MTTGDPDSGLSILHVDDDAALGELVKLYLEREESVDCRVTTVTSPEAALERLRDGDGDDDFDCIVSDYRMPGTNGIDFLGAVRETHPEIPFLLFSGEETGDVAAEVVRAGVTDYLRKGVGTDQYTLLIRRVEHAAGADGRFAPEAETAVDAVGIVGPDERFDRVDPGYADVYDYEPAEVTGKHWTELHPEAEVEHIRTHVLPVVEEGGEWTGRSTGLRADGSTFTESKLVTALDDGRLLIAVSEISPRESD